jgi:hypothetical protein
MDKDEHISQLEAEVEKLRAELAKWINICMVGEGLREQMMLKAILNGAYDSY